MSVRAELLEGRFKQLVKSESGNLSFMFETNQGNMQYCFTAGKKKPIFNSSDVFVLVGSYISGSKFRVSFIINKTKNTEVNLIETKSDWTYKTSLVSAILVTCIFVLFLFFGSFLIPPVDPYGINYIFSQMTQILSIVFFVPLMIVLWALFAFFSNSRKKGSKIDSEILKLKRKYFEYYNKTRSTSTTKTVDKIVNSITKPDFCPNCGGKLPTEAKFCPNCGSKF